jgi:CubicO group peptidase (beta-lactamase class C family)
MSLEHTISALSQIRGYRIDEVKVSAHVIRPLNVMDVISSRSLVDTTYRPTFDFSFRFGVYYHLDVNGFGDAVHEALQDKVAGYVVRLRQHGRTICTREWNWAKTPTDGSESWAPDIGMHIASCSKLITAMAMIKLLDDHRLADSTPIIDFVPRYWGKGPNIDRITFHQLLTHTSGFHSGGTGYSDFEFMRSAVNAGVTQIGKYNYENMNYGLCRILLATIAGDMSPDTIFDISIIQDSNNVVWDYMTIESYLKYVQQNVFGPSGVSDATLNHPDAHALAYPFPVEGQGWNSGDLRTMSGAVGWHMTVDDLLAIMGTFRRSNSIVQAARSQAMLDLTYGIDVWASTSTPMGYIYGKNGWWESKEGKVEQSLLFFMPQDMELVAFVNSPVGSAHEAVVPFVTNAFIANLHMRDILHHLPR